MKIRSAARIIHEGSSTAAFLGLATAALVNAQKCRRRKPRGRSLKDFGKLRPAEQDLLKKCRLGLECVRGTERPKAPNHDNIVSGELIRFLVLEGDARHPVHELGVWLKGAWIEGDIDLECVRSPVFVALRDCHVAGLFRAVDAELPGLNLEGTLLHGIDAARLAMKGSLFLRNGASVKAELRLQGAAIGGNFDCDGSEFCDAEIPADSALRGTSQVAPAAIRADGLIVKGDLLMGKSSKHQKFTAHGEVRLTGARIEGNATFSGGAFLGRSAAEVGRHIKELPLALNADGVVVEGAAFLDKDFSAKGGVALTGAQIGGSLDLSGGTFESGECKPAESGECKPALDAQRMNVKGNLDVRRATFVGPLDLTAAKVSSLVDDMHCWPKGGLHLDGFHYDRIYGPTSARRRIRWLKNQHKKHFSGDFKPQPWEHLIKVLREMGHPDSASKVAIKKEWLWCLHADMGIIRRLLHFLHGVFASFGYRPLTTIIWLGAVFYIFSMYYDYAEKEGLVGPTAPAIQISDKFKDCGGPGNIPWTSPLCPLPPEYTSFDPTIYSLDLILPFVDLQQESNWAPITVGDAGRRLPTGSRMRWLMWVEIIFGWLMSLLLVTALGRVLKRD